MNLEEKVNYPVKRYRNISKLTKLALSAIFALGTAFSLKGCDNDDEPSASYEGVWNINWNYSGPSGCNIIGGPMAIAVTSGGAYGMNVTEDCQNPSHYGTINTRIYGNVNPSTGVIVGTHNSSVCDGRYYFPDITFAGQCDTSTTGSATGSYGFSIDFDKQ